MKTTVEVHDQLLLRAKRHARETGRPLRAVIEAGLRRVLDESAASRSYEWPDLSVGDPNDPDPLETFSWQDLRHLIYEDRSEP